MNQTRVQVHPTQERFQALAVAVYLGHGGDLTEQETPVTLLPHQAQEEFEAGDLRPGWIVQVDGRPQTAAVGGDDLDAGVEGAPQAQGIGQLLVHLRGEGFLLAHMHQEGHVVAHQGGVELVAGRVRRIHAHGVGQPLHQARTAGRVGLQRRHGISPVGMHRHRREEDGRVLVHELPGVGVGNLEGGAFPVGRAPGIVGGLEGQQKKTRPRQTVRRQVEEARDVIVIGPRPRLHTGGGQIGAVAEVVQGVQGGGHVRMDATAVAALLRADEMHMEIHDTRRIDSLQGALQHSAGLGGEPGLHIRRSVRRGPADSIHNATATQVQDEQQARGQEGQAPQAASRSRALGAGVQQLSHQALDVRLRVLSAPAVEQPTLENESGSADATGTERRARLTLVDATLMVMGGVFGVGIFFTPQAVAAALPHPGAFLGAWAVGGLVAVAGGLTFAELAGSFPRRGGAFVFLHEAFGPFPAFLLGWLCLGAISTGAIAVITGFFASTVAGLHPALLGRETWIGVALICGLTALHATGLKHSALFQNGCMLFKLGTAGVFLVAGLVFFQAPPAPETSVPFPPLSSFPRAMLPVLFSLGGYQLVTAISPEVRRPQRTVPRALLLGIAGVLAVYLLLNLTWLRVLGLENLSLDPGFATEVGRRILGPTGEVFLRISMAISALGVCTVVTATSPSFYVAMAERGLFFRPFAHLQATTGAPLNALLVQAAIALTYFLLGGASEILERTVFPEWILNALIGCSLLSLRRRRPDLPRPFKSPAWPLFPLIYTLAALAVVSGNLLTSSWSVTGTGVLLTLAGALLYLPWRRRARGPVGS
ncbi:MAG: hypothetical protein CMK00_03180 [Planctomycetes bacterium]|nr:hypothetical protein [Planctomycetota bacterium]